MRIPLVRGVVRRILAPLLGLGLCAGSAQATWSIIALDRATGEVCVAAATCIEDFDLHRWLPVVVVGKGGACAQSFIDLNGQNRQRIFDGLMDELSPEEILAILAAADSNHEERQYGIVGLGGPPATFTGQDANVAKFGVVGRVGTIEYAIQGNVLTGNVVVTAAEAAFLDCGGDLTQRAMAGMEAARALGGDGRCSCDMQFPDSCGAPPPNFAKSAHTAFIVAARLGDLDGICNTSVGCASGSYYLLRRAVGDDTEPDQVVELQRRYARWRERKQGLADHYASEVLPAAARLPADGVSSTWVTVRLIDLDGVPLTEGGQSVTVTDVSGGATVAEVGALTDNGDGTHGFELTATTTPGEASFRVVVVQNGKTIQLFPDLGLAVDPAADLHAGWAEVSAMAGAEVPLILNRGAAEAGRAYFVLASASGTSPGTPFGGLLVPLNDDRVLRWSLDDRSDLFPGSVGALDGSGRADATFLASPGLLGSFVGSRFDFCALLGPGPDEVTGVAGFDVVP